MDKNKIIELYRSGLSAQSIIHRLGLKISPQYLNRKLREWSVKSHKLDVSIQDILKLKKQGETIAEIARILNRSTSSISDRLKPFCCLKCGQMAQRPNLLITNKSLGKYTCQVCKKKNQNHHKPRITRHDVICLKCHVSFSQKLSDDFYLGKNKIQYICPKCKTTLMIFDKYFVRKFERIATTKIREDICCLKCHGVFRQQTAYENKIIYKCPCKSSLSVTDDYYVRFRGQRESRDRKK